MVLGTLTVDWVSVVKAIPTWLTPAIAILVLVITSRIRETREHHMLFGAEIGKYIDELYEKGTRLHSMWLAAGIGPERVIRPEDIPEEIEIQQWFTGQIDAVRKIFLTYLDFREP